MTSNLFQNNGIDSEEKEKYFLYPGYIFISKEPHLLSTVLGSCVSVCIWDPALKFGGMNHYMHAKPFKKERTAQFGIIAIPYLIKTLIKMGAQKHNLKAHIVGGAQNNQMGSLIVGKQNIEIAEELLRKNFIDIITFDTGGEFGRKVIFDTETGEIVIYKVKKLRDNDWYADKSSNNR